MFDWIAKNWVVVSGAVTFLASGIAWLWAQKSAAKKSTDDLLERHIDRLQAELTTTRDQNQQLQNELSQVKVELAVVTAKGGARPPTDTLRQFIHEFPGLLWAKRRVQPGVYVILAVSKSHALLFKAGPPEAMDDLRDADVFGAEVGAEMMRTDEQAYKAQSRVDFKIDITQSPSGVTGTLTGIEWPIHLPDGTDLIFGYGHHGDV